MPEEPDVTADGNEGETPVEIAQSIVTCRCQRSGGLAEAVGRRNDVMNGFLYDRGRGVA